MTVELDATRAVAEVSHAGRLWFRLRLLSSLDTLDGPDETLGRPAVSRHGNRIEVRCASSRWRERVTVLETHPDRIELHTTVRGRGDLLTAHLLGGHRAPGGFLPSGSALDTLFSPNPDHPRRVARPAAEPAVIGVVGDGAEPGVGRWLFCPAPWCYAVSRDGEWAALGLAAPVAEQTFTSFHYSGGTDGFALRLDYEGHTHVDGEFTTPTVVLQFGHPTPEAAVAAHADLLRTRGLAPPVPTDVPRHWREPMFCGWGAQHALALRTRQSTQDLATQRNYDAFLSHLARHGVVPGTVVVDDKWATHYATCRPDRRKWPDLAGWIARRHEEDQRVLLWWKAWDPEGAPDEACVTLPDGTPVALDPEHELGRRTVVAAVTHMIRDLNADGLKVDFLAKTPSGTALRHSGHAGRSWGAALLHTLLKLVHDTVKELKPDALVVTHTPNPAFADVTDMVRLNDIRMLDAIDPDGPVVPHMRYRASVVAAALPGMPVDTDGWCLPNRAEWRAYLAEQPGLGVPALYYATHLDLSGEPLTAADLAEVARVWAGYRHALDETSSPA